MLAGEAGPVHRAHRDYVRAVAEQIGPWVPGGLFALGTDGFGRSEIATQLAAALRGRRRERSPWPPCISFRKQGQVERQVRGRGDQELGHRSGKDRSDSSLSSQRCVIVARGATSAWQTRLRRLQHDIHGVLQSMAIDFKVPDLGENVESGDIVSVLVKEGDEIQADRA